MGKVTPFELRPDQFETAEGNLRYFVAEHVTVLLADEERRRTTQLIQIQLRKTNGAIFAQAPYFPANTGLVGECQVIADANLRWRDPTWRDGRNHLTQSEVLTSDRRSRPLFPGRTRLHTRSAPIDSARSR